MTKVYFCSIPSIALRNKPEHQSEQISEILFGEGFNLLEKSDQWARVECHWDGYLGWIPFSHGIQPILADQPSAGKTLVVISDLAIVEHPDGYAPLYLSAGSIIRPAMFPAGCHIWSGHTASYPRSAVDDPLDVQMKMSRQWLGTPYHWGGRSRFGTDCSGFTQVVFGASGIPIPRDAKDQLALAPVVYDIDEPHGYCAGNLAFFGASRDKITHVGFLTRSDRIIHASGTVREDLFSRDGIYNGQVEGKVSHKLQAIAAFPGSRKPQHDAVL